MSLRSFLSLSLYTAFASIACGQADPSQTATLSFDAFSGAWSLGWNGLNGRTYFIQRGDETLTAWTFWPVIEQGTNAPIAYRFWLNPQPDRLFLRTLYTDQPAPDPFTADFDGDGIPNGWEIENGLSPFNAPDAALTVGGLTNLARYQASLGQGSDPATANTLGLILSTP